MPQFRISVPRPRAVLFGARLIASQPFWVTIALIVWSWSCPSIEPTFGTTENAANVTRNFAPIGIMAMGMTVVIITGGIDLSVGSVMGLVAIVAGLFSYAPIDTCRLVEPAGITPGMAFTMGMIAGLACGASTAFSWPIVGMPSFVVTLGMLSIARSLAVVFSANQMLYQFGPDAPTSKPSVAAKSGAGPVRRALPIPCPPISGSW